jgi:hypothetical protein
MKKIVCLITLFLWGCSKPELPLPEVLSIDDIFSVSESMVTNGQSIHFDLPSEGTYVLTLIDKESEQVISRERFIGKSGENVKKVFTNSLQSKYLYLTLSDSQNKEINRTTLKLNK